MATATETDVSQLVEAAFDDCRCGSTTKEVQHQGKIAGLWVGHTCANYLLCEAHLKRAIEVCIPRHKRKVEKFGHIICAECNHKFPTNQEFVTVYPL
ncbi:Uncharacterised protein [Mycobacteroides abscessus subsp. abscessus]|uniref:Bacteriophage protein n=1 Tax=Mycobacteroides abscessus subsp. abscessus TaxID=1185650 RepID=A0AB38D0V3_9MYCO|nr:hypothetical protein [Mycobacteroides abscessus]SHX06627.1 Uncharacterised protein [Mycobacteroides abscessus subsp. abscessus]SIA11480.1 Uncharacterised protein [Mycobacteroides abscessus subsp. abscessus]SIB13924.1 Uncharacterised protein [Mycobacteroides abscessus subsp. abscessus]SIB14781.1 Uncharacterised protein [Mycobacteroides abscessus subsp. abscessus]SIB17746.1 Uncharacterised protein [Mycobacteroides abscessus subsp. abscessus]